MRFPKCTFSGPRLSLRGLVWYLLNSSKACPAGAGASRGHNKVPQNMQLLRSTCWLGNQSHYYLLLQLSLVKFLPFLLLPTCPHGQSSAHSYWLTSWEPWRSVHTCQSSLCNPGLPGSRRSSRRSSRRIMREVRESTPNPPACSQ